MFLHIFSTGVRRRRYGVDVASAPPRLATPTEAVVAAALDRVRVTWSYEPTRFVISYNADGTEHEACSPDFFLPAYGLFLEISDGSPRRLNRKRAKLKRLHASHPEVRVELLGSREIAALERNPGQFLARLADPAAA
jgi:hypothetical protein